MSQDVGRVVKTVNPALSLPSSVMLMVGKGKRERERCSGSYRLPVFYLSYASCPSASGNTNDTPAQIMVEQGLSLVSCESKKDR